MRAKLCGGPEDGQIVQMEEFFRYYVFRPPRPIGALSDGPFNPVPHVTGVYLPTTETDGPLHLYRWAGWNGPEHRDPGPVHTARERLEGEEVKPPSLDHETIGRYLDDALRDTNNGTIPDRWYRRIIYLCEVAAAYWEGEP